MAGTITDRGATLLVEGDWGLDQFRANNGNETLVDCTDASFTVQQDSSLSGGANRYPVFLDSWDGPVTLRGGNIGGTVSLSENWNSLYYGGTGGNSAAIFVRGTDQQVIIENWRIDRCFDGIRHNITSSGLDSGYYTIRNCHVTNARDDAVECDQGQGGLIQDCLFEDVFIGVSNGDSSTYPGAVNKIVDYDNVLIKTKKYMYSGSIRQGFPFKIYGSSPQVRANGLIVAVDGFDTFDSNLYTNFFKKLRGDSGSDNYWLNLSGESLPAWYPKIPASHFTYLEGRAAQDHWNAARTSFLEEKYLEVSKEGLGSMIHHVLDINPDSGAIRIQTMEAYSALVTVGATNKSTKDTVSLTLTVA